MSSGTHPLADDDHDEERPRSNNNNGSESRHAQEEAADLSSGPSGLTEDEEEANRRRVGHINDRDRSDFKRAEDDSSSSYEEEESDAETSSYRHESYIFARTEWKGEKKPEGVHHENWFLLDHTTRFHFRFHFRRHKRRAVQGALRLKDLVVGLPWHQIRVAVISLLFIASMALFMSVDAPDDNPPTRLAGVSLAQPIISSPIPRPSVSLFIYLFSLLSVIIIDYLSFIPKKEKEFNNSLTLGLTIGCWTTTSRWTRSG
jgi:hypothetical protein